jgi:hypothetical protein
MRCLQILYLRLSMSSNANPQLSNVIKLHTICRNLSISYWGFDYYVFYAEVSSTTYLILQRCNADRLCSLVVRLPGYRHPEVRIQFPALPDFLRSSVSATGCTQPLTTTTELLGRKSSVSGLDNLEYGRRDPSQWPRDTLYQKKLALTSLTSGVRSVGIV